ncbi:hypothetical protein BJV82DRAFT_631806 [Fennellomyces sp. T-0311]|nr:hypothetical protein BJV82DRAFT_631806 [Fennellomyces sp. T-0311]
MSLVTRSWLFRQSLQRIDRRHFTHCSSLRSTTRTDDVSDVLQSIESLRPKQTARVLKNNDYNQLCKQLDKSFTVPQLKLYLKKHNRHILPKSRKQDLLNLIVNGFWGYSSREIIQNAERERKRNAIEAHVKASKEELFFVIGEEGSTLRHVEEQYNVRITILVDQGQYIIEGLRKDVIKAREEIRRQLLLVHADFQVTQQLKNNISFDDVAAKMMSIIPTISKQCNTFISISKDRFTLAARSKKSIDQATLLLAQTISELDVTTKKPLSAADHTLLDVTRADGQLEFVPLHDSQAMPLTLKSFGWSRLHPAEGEKNQKYLSSTESFSFYNLGPGESTNLSASGIKELIGQNLGPADDSNIHLEARFGAVLFENLKSKKSLILETPKTGLFSAQKLKDFAAGLDGRRLFFGVQPPANITAPFIPVVGDDGVHRRSVVLEYVNRNDLVSFGNPENVGQGPLHRVRVEFLVQEDGSLRLEKTEGEHKRVAVDLISVAGNVDVRVLAKKYTAFSGEGMISIPNTYSHATLPASLQTLVDQCELTGYSDFYCPPSFHLGSPMDLLEVSFRDEARYMADNSLVTLSDIDAQYSQARQTELTVTPVDNDELSQSLNGYIQPRNGLDRWNTFAETVRHLANRWHYSFQ